MNYWDPKQPGEGLFRLLLLGRQELKQGRNIDARTLRLKLKQEPWRSAAYWLAVHGILSLRSYTTQDHLPKGGTLTPDRAYSHQSLIEKMPSRPAYEVTWRRHFLN